MIERLSTIEKLFVAAADAGLGQGFALAVMAEGGIDRARLDRAWRILQGRFPLLRSVLVEGKLLRDGWSGFAWRPEIDRDFPVVWEDLPVGEAADLAAYESAVVERTEAASNTDIRIREEPPLRLLALVSPGRTALVFRAHHSGVDGAAIVSLCMEAIEIYNALDRGERPGADPVAARNRGVLRYLRALGWRRLRAALAADAAVRKSDEPKENEPLPLAWTERSCRTGCAQIVFAAAESRSLRDACKRDGMTLNEAFLCAVARAGHSFAVELGAPIKKITLAVPVHLRPYLDLGIRETISNQAITVNLAVPARAVESAQGLLPIVREFSESVKRTSLPLIHLAKAVLAGILPRRILVWIFRRMLAAPNPDPSTPTLTVSNVGPIWTRPDGSSIDRIGDAPIVRLRNVYQSGYPSSGTISLYTFGGMLNLQMSYPLGGWSREEGRAFLARIRRSLYELLEVPAP